MPALLAQLLAIFDEQGWTYTHHPDQSQLSTRFQTPQGSISLTISTPTEETLTFEALCLATLDVAHTEVLSTLEPYLPENLSLRRAPHDGEVRLRLLLPLSDASLTADVLDEPMSLLLALTPLLRAALPLVQQGMSPEEALQTVQAERPPALEAEEALQALLQELVAYEDKHDRSSLEHKRTLCQTILAQLLPQEAPALWAAIQEELGHNCQRLYDMTGVQAHAQAATAAYQAARNLTFEQ